MIRRMRWIAPVVLVVAVCVPAALAANGDPLKRHTKADMARARKASIYASDLGTGWKAVRTKNGKSGSRPRCSDYRPDQSDLVETGTYDSPDFTRPNSSFVASTSGVFRTARMARAGYARVAAPQLPGCFAEIFRNGTGNPAAVTIVNSGPLRFPRLGDRSNAFRLVLTYAAQGVKVPVSIDLVLFNRGRIDVAMVFLGIGGAYPASFEQALARRVADRAR